MLQGIVIRGTTPEHEFYVPYSRDMIKDIRITYAQNKKAVFVKKIYDCRFENEKVYIDLSQAETLMFVPNRHLEIEIKILLLNNKVVMSEEPILLRVVDTLNDEVME